MAINDNEDIEMVYDDLIRGSRNHMCSFNRQLLRNGGSNYVAQYLPQSEVDEIVAEGNERGGR